MNRMIVPNSFETSPAGPVLGRVIEALPDMSPQLRKAAQFVLDNPNEIGLGTVREIADAADVKPNTPGAPGPFGRLRGLRGFPRALPRGAPERQRELPRPGALAAVDRTRRAARRALRRDGGEQHRQHRTALRRDHGGCGQGGGRLHCRGAHQLRAGCRPALSPGAAVRLPRPHGTRLDHRGAARRQPADRRPGPRRQWRRALGHDLQPLPARGGRGRSSRRAIRARR